MNNTPTIQEGKLWSALPYYQNRSVMDVMRKTVDLDDPDGWAEAAQMLSIYADPRYETARYLVVTNGRVSDHIAISSQIPNFTSVYPHTWMVEKLAYDCERSNSYLLFMHNHPSGLVAPSENDIKITKYLDNRFTDMQKKKRFLGHIIVGGNGMASFTKGASEDWKGVRGYDVMELEDLPNRPNYTRCINVLGSLGTIMLPDYAQKIAENSGINPAKNSIILYTNIAGYVTGARSVPNKDLYYAQKTLGNDVVNDAREAGAASAHLVILREDKELFRMVQYNNRHSQHLANALMSTRDGTYINIPENERSRAVFNEGETVSLKIDDSREIRKKMRQKQSHSHEGYGLGF